jgi:hypothetical protein
MEKKFLWALVTASAVSLTACGGGGGSGGGGTTGTSFTGTTTAATIDAGNSDELTIAAASGAKQALSADNTNSPSFRPADSGFDTAMEEFKAQISTMMNGSRANRSAERTDDISTGLCNAGGTATVTYPDNASYNNYNWSAELNNCTYSASGYTAVYNGTVSGSYSESGNIETDVYSYSNFTVTITYLGVTETYTLNYTETCSYNYSTHEGSCDVVSDFEGFDDRTYRVTDASVSGNNSSGYNINATVYDPDYGYFTISSSNLTFCDSGLPGSGSITYTDGSESVTVDFLSCTEYQYTYNGDTYGPFTW